MAINIRTIMIGVIVIVIAALALGYIDLADIKNVVDGEPDFDSVNSAPSSVTILDRTYAVTNAFCVGTTTLPWTCGKPVDYTCNSKRNDAIDLFEGTCKFSTNNDATCQNKYLAVCGSGKGIPTIATCDRDQPVEFSGVITIQNGKLFVRNYGLVVESLFINPVRLPQGIISEKALVRMTFMQEGHDNVAVDYPVEVYSFMSEQIPIKATYTIGDLNCDLNKIDDHIIQLRIELFDENGKLISTDTTSVGLSKGVPIKAGW